MRVALPEPLNAVVVSLLNPALPAKVALNS
jgi:hypothetical protein